MAKRKSSPPLFNWNNRRAVIRLFAYGGLALSLLVSYGFPMLAESLGLDTMFSDTGTGIVTPQNPSFMTPKDPTLSF